MHENRIRLGLRHGFGVDLIGGQCFHTGVVIFIPHRNPAIGDNNIRLGQRTIKVGHPHLATIGIGGLNHPLIGAIARRAGHIH